MKRTKIICTIGPASANEQVLEEMIKAGMNVARLNFSHGTHSEHLEKIEMIKRVRERLDSPIPIMLDTKGPEYRIRTFKDGKVTLKEGDKFVFTSDETEGDSQIVSVSYKNLPNELDTGDVILLNNGLMEFRVDNCEGSNIHTTVVTGGVLSDRKSMSFPGKVFRQDYLSEQDKADLLFGIENGVDFVAASFVSLRQNVDDVREFLNKHGGSDIDVIAKIENSTGVENIEEILDAADGIMVARGDMGVEIPFEQLPAIQKKLITTCRLLGKRVITATEMLESMITNKRPTRAEISDVANAVYDGTSALMLSGETAVGKNPVEAVRAMAKIAEQAEQDINYVKRFRNSDFRIKNQVDALSHACCALTIDVDAKLIVVCSRSGSTARMVSRFRQPKFILGMTTDRRVWRKLALSWGVIPVISDEYQSTDVLFYNAMQKAKEAGLASKGDVIVITGGQTNGCSGNSNIIKVENVN